jgi:hypothetical protein
MLYIYMPACLHSFLPRHVSPLPSLHRQMIRGRQSRLNPLYQPSRRHVQSRGVATCRTPSSFDMPPEDCPPSPVVAKGVSLLSILTSLDPVVFVVAAAAVAACDEDVEAHWWIELREWSFGGWGLGVRGCSSEVAVWGCGAGGGWMMCLVRVWMGRFARKGSLYTS